MELYNAERSEIIRCSQKDNEILTTLQRDVSEVVKSLAGDAAWIRVYEWLTPLTRFGYLLATTATGAQTPGEEYLGLVQATSRSRRLLPSLPRRVLWCALEATGPRLIERQLRALQQADAVYYARRDSAISVPIARLVVSTILRHASFALLERAHTTAFYLGAGIFYSIWSRIANIRFLALRPQTSAKIEILFKLIGVTFIVQCIVAIVLSVRQQLLQQQQAAVETRLETSDSALRPSTSSKHADTFRCDICMDDTEPVATPCGHVFCFDCIFAHSEQADRDSTLGVCPQCRFQFELRCLVPLLNL